MIITNVYKVSNKRKKTSEKHLFCHPTIPKTTPTNRNIWQNCNFGTLFAVK